MALIRRLTSVLCGPRANTLAGVYRRLVDRRLLQNGLVLTSMSFACGILGYVYQIVVARSMKTHDYAMFCGLMALIGVVVSPFGALATTLTRRVAAIRSGGSGMMLQSTFIATTAGLVAIGALSGLFFACVAPYAENVVKTVDHSILWLCGAVILTNVMLIATNSFLQGLQHFRSFTLVVTLAVCVKVIASALWIRRSGSDIAAALAAVSVSAAFAWFAGAYVVMRTIRAMPRDGRPFKMPTFALAPIACANIGMALMSQRDVLYASHYLMAESAGQFAAAAILAKATLAVPTSLCIALLPMVAANDALQKPSRPLGRTAVAITLFFGIVAAVAAATLGPLFMHVFYGPQFTIAGRILPVLSAAALPLGLVAVAEHFLAAKGRTLFSALLLGAVPVELALFELWRPNPLGVAAIVGSFNAFVALTGYFLLWRIDYAAR